VSDSKYKLLEIKGENLNYIKEPKITILTSKWLSVDQRFYL